MALQIRRTITPNRAPTGLKPGQLGVELASVPPKLWCGAPNSVDVSERVLLNGLPGPPGPPGRDGRSFVVLGHFDTLDELEQAHQTGNAGDAYAVGTETPLPIYIWGIDVGEWVNIGPLEGPEGPEGPAGPMGPVGEIGVIFEPLYWPQSGNLGWTTQTSPPPMALIRMGNTVSCTIQTTSPASSQTPTTPPANNLPVGYRPIIPIRENLGQASNGNPMPITFGTDGSMVVQSGTTMQGGVSRVISWITADPYPDGAEIPVGIALSVDLTPAFEGLDDGDPVTVGQVKDVLRFAGFTIS